MRRVVPRTGAGRRTLESESVVESPCSSSTLIHRIGPGRIAQTTRGGAQPSFVSTHPSNPHWLHPPAQARWSLLNAPMILPVDADPDPSHPWVGRFSLHFWRHDAANHVEAWGCKVAVLSSL